jgi:nicotinate-nucleotide adenylyltransferase
MKIGLFFGTFNPVHCGHIKIVHNVLEQKHVDQVWIVLTPLSPFKKTQKIIDFHHRIIMLEKAFQGIQNIVISDVETRLKTPNYTINTLSYLRGLYPKNEFTMILGSDNFQTIYLWKDYELILKNHHIFIYPRKDFNINDLNSHVSTENVTTLVMEKIPVSSSLIREEINNKKIKLYLNQAVYKYIIDHKLY